MEVARFCFGKGLVLGIEPKDSCQLQALRWAVPFVLVVLFQSYPYVLRVSTTVILNESEKTQYYFLEPCLHHYYYDYTIRVKSAC